MEELKITNRINVDVTPKARAVWPTLGTEYPKSFPAFKELIDNSISAAKDKKCHVLIKVEEISDLEYKISIEDNAGGVNDPSVLLTVGTESHTKEGMYNYFGYGLKNSLAYFQPKWHLSRWYIQSKTDQDIENSQILEVNAPYVYNNEENEEYGHLGMHVEYKDSFLYRGQFSVPSTFIEFTTPKTKFNNLHPLKKGRKSSTLKSVIDELSELISFFYRPLFMSNSLEVDIYYCENDGKRNFKKTSVKFYDLPQQEHLHTFQTRLTTEGGKLNVKATWFIINRDINSPYVFPQERGMVLYVNGILVEPYKWEEAVFGGNAFHPSMNSLGCYVEVTGPKTATPELSVSKTKIQETGENYQSLISLLNQECPNQGIDSLKNSANTQNEIVKRDRRYDLHLRAFQSQGVICNLEKERLLTLPGGVKGNESLKADIFYQWANQNKIVIEEFKKDKINSLAVGQIMNYYHILKLEFPDYEIELTLVSDKCQETAKQLIKMYKTSGVNINFKSFTDIGIS